MKDYARSAKLTFDFEAVYLTVLKIAADFGFVSDAP
jgi:hypothetical protein